MKYQMAPIIDIFELEDELKKQYGINAYPLAPLLFGDDFNNDSYKSYYFGKNYSYDKEIIRLVKEILRKEFPTYNSILIDVSW